MTGCPGQSAELEYRRRIKEARSRVRRFAPYFGLVVVAVGYLAGLPLLWSGLLAVFVAAAIAPPRTAAVTNARYWKTGAKGEQSTAQILELLKKEGWEIFHDLCIWDRANIDHLVIGPPGVFLIDSKVRRRSDFLGLPRTAHELDVTVRMARSVQAALRVGVTPIWAVHGQSMPAGGFSYKSVHILGASDLVKGPHARKSLDMLRCVGGYIRADLWLSPQDVKELAQAALDEFGTRR